MQTPGHVYGRGLKHFIPGAAGSSAVHPESASITPSSRPDQHAGGSAPFGRGIDGLPLRAPQNGCLARLKSSACKTEDFTETSLSEAAKLKDNIQSAISGEDAEAKLQSDFLAIEKMVTAWEVQKSSAEPKDPGTLLQTPFTFNYKKREYEGQALHVLALYKGESQSNLLERLLSMRADIEAECACANKVRLNHTSIQAIHLAAASGNVAALQTLLNHNADVNVRATRKVRDGDDMVPKPHYTALYDAVYHAQIDAVHMLLDHRADANIPHYSDQTPLHLAVEQGFVTIAKALLKGGACLDVGPLLAAKTLRWQLHHNDAATKQTPLRLACECGRFPHRSLFLLTDQSLGDLVEVACHSPQAALSMIHDEGVVHPVWRDALVSSRRTGSSSSSVSGVTANFTHGLVRWCQLMEMSPRAAVALLDSVTTAPEVTNANRHYLYEGAFFRKSEDMRCYYSEDATWDCDSEEKVWPEWHDRLAPQRREYQTAELLSGGAQEQVTVKIRRLELRGVIHHRLMHTLAGTTDLTVFGSLPVQAIVKFAWEQVASGPYYHYLLVKAAEMCALICWVIFPPGDARRPLVWSILLAAAGRDVYREICEMYGYFFLLRKPQEYIGNPWNALDWFCIVPLLATLWPSGPDDYDEQSVYSAVAAFVRWLQLCFLFRAVSCTGRKLLPIVHSFAALGGITLITIFVFMGFLHSFMALGDFNMDGDEMIWTYMVNAFRLLFMGDGDGIDFVLQLGGADSNGNDPTRVFFFLSVLVFCVCILNLFIAVHTEAYDAAQQEADVRFIQQRASVCFSCLVRPHWPPKRKWIPAWLRGYCMFRFNNPWRAYWVIMCMGMCLWYVLITAFGSLHPVVPSMVLLGAILLADTVYLQRPWDCERNCEHYLWMCHRADFDPGAVVPKIDTPQDHSSRHFRRIDSTISRLEGKLDEVSVQSGMQSEGLSREVRDLGGRMTQLEGAVGALAPAVRDLVQELQRRRVDETRLIPSQASTRLN